MTAPPAMQTNLHVADVAKEFAYFTEVLGFTPEFVVAGAGGGATFAGVWWGRVGRGGRVILGDLHEALHGHYDHGDFGRQMEQHPLGTGVVLYFFVKDVDRHHQRLVAKGAVIDEPPTDQFWGDRCISVLTPAGFYVTFAQPIKGFRFPPGFEARIQWGPTVRRPAKRAKPRPAPRRRRGRSG